MNMSLVCCIPYFIAISKARLKNRTISGCCSLFTLIEKKRFSHSSLARTEPKTFTQLLSFLRWRGYCSVLRVCPWPYLLQILEMKFLLKGTQMQIPTSVHITFKWKVVYCRFRNLTSFTFQDMCTREIVYKHKQ